jgi:hypothetical protein
MGQNHPKIRLLERSSNFSFALLIQKNSPLLRFRKSGITAIYYFFVHAVLRT